MKQPLLRHLQFAEADALRCLFGLVLVVALTACAPDVARRPMDLMPAAGSTRVSTEVLEDTTLPVGPGYERVIRRGSVWTLVGSSNEGEVFKPVDRVFTVEGAHVHEAYLVLKDDNVVGFYLPVERAFAPVTGGKDIHLKLQGR
jgi:hypothetical protein